MTLDLRDPKIRKKLSTELDIDQNDCFRNLITNTEKYSKIIVVGKYMQKLVFNCLHKEYLISEPLGIDLIICI